MKDFQQNLIYYRNKRGLSCENVAQQLGISVEEMEKFESGELSPTADEIMLLAKLYKISAKKLFKKHRSLAPYTISKKKLVGYNRYGLDQGVGVIAVPIVVFLALITMFIPSLKATSGTVSLMEVLFLTGNTDYIILGCFIFFVMAFSIIYWAVLLSLGAYTMAKCKVLNNVVLSVCAIAFLAICLTCLLLFRGKTTAFAYVCDGAVLISAITQAIVLILMNLDGSEDSRVQIYTYHETTETGYDTRCWYTLGMTAFSLAALCLMFTVSYRGNLWFFWGINKTMFEMMFGASTPLCLLFGVICLAVLGFNIVYWVIICTLPQRGRRKTAKANNVLITIMSIVLLVDTVAFMSYFGLEFLTDSGIALYVMLFVTAGYGLMTIPIINSKKKRYYVQEEHGLRKVNRVQGQRPGKILAYKLPTMAQIFLCILLGCALGLSFLDVKLVYIAFMSGGALLLELVSIILQFKNRYVSVGMFAFAIILNTCIEVFGIYLLMLSIFGTLTLGARIAMPIVAGFLTLEYANFIIFVKPIRDASNQM